MPMSRPALRTSRSWISGSGSALPRAASSSTRTISGTSQPERPSELAGEQLRDERLGSLAGGVELDDVEPVVVRLEQSRQRATFAECRDVARRPDGPKPRRGGRRRHRRADARASRTMQLFVGPYAESAMNRIVGGLVRHHAPRR